MQRSSLASNPSCISVHLHALASRISVHVYALASRIERSIVSVLPLLAPGKIPDLQRGAHARVPGRWLVGRGGRPRVFVARGRHHEGRKLQRGDGLQRRRGQLPPKLYAEILSNYTVLHHNLKYTWLDPKDDDVVKDYEALYGPDDDRAPTPTPPPTKTSPRTSEGEDEAEGEADAP